MLGKVQGSHKGKKQRCFTATDKRTGEKKEVCIWSSGKKRKKLLKKAKV